MHSALPGNGPAATRRRRGTVVDSDSLLDLDK